MTNPANTRPRLSRSPSGKSPEAIISTAAASTRDGTGVRGLPVAVPHACQMTSSASGSKTPRDSRVAARLVVTRARVRRPRREASARARARRLSHEVAEHADHRDERHDLRRHQQLAIPLHRVSEPARRADQLGGDDGGPRRRDAEPQRNDAALGSAAGTTTRVTIVRLRHAHRARGIDQAPVDAAHAGDGAEQDGKERGVGHDEDRQRVADAEDEQRQRDPRDAGNRPEAARSSGRSRRRACGSSPSAIPAERRAVMRARGSSACGRD